ncbi:MAG: TolB protein [Solirubrobacteraceae bacterium]|nr:TolB protein [Solirubrobacteraceae bacterium]
MHGLRGHAEVKLRRHVGADVVAIVAASALAATPAGAATNGLLAFEATTGGQTIKTADPVKRLEPALSPMPLQVPGVPPDQGSANAAWSPDGTLLAYSSRVGGRTDIYVVNANAAVNGASTTPRRITQDPVAAIDPTWSPDGGQIAFTSLQNGAPDIYVTDIRSGALQRLTTDPGPDEQADWSPDGTLIAFQSRRRAGNEDIWLMGRDGSGQRALTSDPGEESDADWKPDDGARLAYSGGAPGGSREIYSIAAAGGTPKQLTGPPLTGRNAFPAWSPDGNEIAFSADGTVLVMAADGVTAASPTRIVASDATDPDWAILPVPVATAQGDVTVKRPREAAAMPVSSGEAVTLPTGTVVDTSGGGSLTVPVNRPAVAATTPDSTATVTNAVVSVTARTPEVLGLSIHRPDCPATEVAAAKSKPRKKPTLTVKTSRGKGGKKRAQVRPSSPEGHMSSRDTSYVVVVTCNGTYVRVREGVVRVTRTGGRRSIGVGAHHSLFLPRAR